MAEEKKEMNKSTNDSHETNIKHSTERHYSTDIDKIATAKAYSEVGSRSNIFEADPF